MSNDKISNNGIGVPDIRGSNQEMPEDVIKSHASSVAAGSLINNSNISLKIASTTETSAEVSDADAIVLNAPSETIQEAIPPEKLLSSILNLSVTGVRASVAVNQVNVEGLHLADTTSILLLMESFSKGLRTLFDMEGVYHKGQQKIETVDQLVALVTNIVNAATGLADEQVLLQNNQVNLQLKEASLLAEQAKGNEADSGVIAILEAEVSALNDSITINNDRIIAYQTLILEDTEQLETQSQKLEYVEIGDNASLYRAVTGSKYFEPIILESGEEFTTENRHNLQVEAINSQNQQGEILQKKNKMNNKQKDSNKNEVQESNSDLALNNAVNSNQGKVLPSYIQNASLPISFFLPEIKIDKATLAHLEKNKRIESDQIGNGSHNQEQNSDQQLLTALSPQAITWLQQLNDYKEQKTQYANDNSSIVYSSQAMANKNDVQAEQRVQLALGVQFFSQILEKIAEILRIEAANKTELHKVENAKYV